MFVEAAGVRFFCEEQGKGPLALFFHGFPETHRCWREVLPLVAGAGFRAVAPDLKGYGETDKPRAVGEYRLPRLSAEIAALIDALGAKKAHIIGHDWGGALAWDFARRYPEKVDRLVVLNAPHPWIFRKRVWTLRQLRRSWYMFFFQLPFFPERMILGNAPLTAKRMFRGWSRRKESFSDEDLAAYVEAWRKPGAMKAMINWYRAAFRRPLDTDRRVPGDGRIGAPTLLIWAEEDRALGKELTYGMEPLFTGPFRIEYVPGCSHWVVEEQPERVAKSVIAHLKS